MLRLGKLTDYAIAVMAQMVRKPSCASASQLAHDSGIPEPTVAKILKTLVRAGLVESTRGAAGGYALHHDPHEITVSDIITAFEGPVSLTACLSDHECCSLEKNCAVRGGLGKVNLAIRDALKSLTLAEIAGMQNGGMTGIGQDVFAQAAEEQP